MAKLISVAFLLLAGFAALKPASLSWAFVGAVALFELWLVLRMRALDHRGPVAVGEAPYHFTAQEAGVVRRFRFYFAFPALAGGAASALSAVGLASIVLVFWLTYRHAYPQAVLIGLNLFAVGWLTRRVAPVYALRVAVSRGKRDAMQALALFDPVWDKIRRGNAE